MHDYAVLVQDVVKSYGNTQILKKLCMKVEKGQIYGLLGSSGCGKTTLLSAIVGRKKIESGEIWVLGGKPGDSESGVLGPKVGYMPQDISLVGEFTIKDAIFYFGRIYNMKEKVLEERYQELVELLNLPPDNRFLKECSGGQKRRVSFAVALVHKPKLLILDEPTVGIDPLLREKIWTYLIDITKKDKLSVIITTHYIEECRQADKIGLMRDGRLLTEDSPDNLLNTFKTETLEEVFLILSQQQEYGKLPEVPTDQSSVDKVDEPNKSHLSSSTLSSLQSIPEGYKSTDALTKRKLKPNINFMSGQRMKALLDKNSKQFYRNPVSIFPKYLVGTRIIPVLRGAEIWRRNTEFGEEKSKIPEGQSITVCWSRIVEQLQILTRSVGFLLLMPILEILMMLYSVGLDMKNIPIGIVNDETMSTHCPNFLINGTVQPENETVPCHFHNLSCRFLKYHLTDPMIKKVEYDSVEEAVNDVRHGKINGVMYIPGNFSESLEHRLEDGANASNAVLEFSTIKVRLDMSNQQIGVSVQNKLVDLFFDFQKSVYEDCHFVKGYGELPVQTNYVYGSKDESYQVFIIPGTIVTMMFFFGSIMTSQIMITEKHEGIWDRSIVAGVTSLELITSHLLFQGLIAIFQSLEMIVLVYVIYQYDYIGNIVLMYMLLYLQGVCGMGLGLFISVICTNITMANNATMGFYLPMLMISGVLWPLEGMPEGLQILAKILPAAIPIESLNNVIKKGLTIDTWKVASGLGVSILWIIIFAVLSLIFLKRQR